MAGVVGVVRYVSFRRLRLRLRRLEQETAVQKERARIAKDLHDDLGAHLSQIAMLSELAQTDFHKPEQAHGHIDLIFRTARSVTRSLDEIVWAVNPRNDSLDRFTAHLCTFAPEFLRAAGHHLPPGCADGIADHRAARQRAPPPLPGLQGGAPQRGQTCRRDRSLAAAPVGPAASSRW